MKDLDPRHWRGTNRPQSIEEVKQKRDRLRSKWEKYDWTRIVKESINISQKASNEDYEE